MKKHEARAEKLLKLNYQQMKIEADEMQQKLDSIFNVLFEATAKTHSNLLNQKLNNHGDERQ